MRREVFDSSAWAGFHIPAGVTPAPPKVTPDLLSSEGPERRTDRSIRNDADAPPSITTTASDDGSLLIRVRMGRSLAGCVTWAEIFLFPASMVLLKIRPAPDCANASKP